MRSIDFGGACLAVAALAALPLLNPGEYLLGVLTLGLIYGIWAAGWDFMSGLTGRANFGYGLFIGLGAYFGGFANTLWRTDPWMGLPIGVGVGVIAALLVGLPTLRLRGPYFALAMLAASVVMERLVLILWRYTGGDEGLNDLDPLVESHVAFYYVALAFLVGSAAILLRLSHSRLGLVLRAIRGDEAACQAAGLDVTFYKIGSLMISAAFGGLGGVLYAHFQLQVSPQLFSMQMAMAIITMAYVGGLGSIYGPVVAAIVLTLATELLRPFGAWRLLVYSILLIIALFLARDGLVAPAWQALRRALSRGRDAAPEPLRQARSPGTSA
ncbi:branched-chain amino acid transport system permease protein [Roseomonas rosea]|uniref:Branched-chain amino acid transport system permease protein n=1 Tax=Muricoccus roseus TaxID=198092 RepID=A0A1M6PTY5_9PROT|nr:branched-chain amino acid ABC transporter permease [Roseomonas rosea]SHK11375.1 branched-chain amino acid transport system permease protein [Roseomonas rosea]